ncbi:hypothetical protein NON08_05225 [Cetobacterium somerae]|uniref:hypothetical protein n=1 Tax=Cetobacterium sp. NK01 TaxID=2993530 RepID=UPI002115FBCB|nr:hypothetical protein [Cetobacterium sp. NK01]MCQ8211929.1 hypothetical protein [Cetobacterium sp. NK01]
MNKNMKNKGLTFLETIVSVTIIFLVSSFFVYQIINYNEKMDLESSRRILQMFFMKYLNKSIYEKNKYFIEINTLEKYVSVKKLNTEEIERISLPPKLKYEIPYNNARNSKFKLETTITGNLSKSFTLYIFGYKEQVENRLAFYIFQKEKLLKINTYLNLTVKGINYNNIIEYHYSQEGENRIGWIEEE